MADTMYRRPVSLQDLLLGQNSSVDAPVAPAPSGDTSGYGFLNPQQQQSALETLLRPTNLGPEPTVDSRNVGSEIFNALGDALGAYASGVTGGPRTDYTGRYFGKREIQKQERDQFRKQAALVKTQDERQKAEFLISRDEQARINAENKRAQKELKDLTIAQQNESLKQARDLAAAAEAATAARDAARFEWEKKKASDDNAKDIAVAKIHAGAAGGNAANKFDQVKLVEVMDNISGLADIAQVALAGGDPANDIPKMTPQQIRNRIRRAIEYSGLSADARTAARAAANEVEQELRDFETAQANEAVKGTTVPEAPYKETSGYKLLHPLQTLGLSQ